jgi:hypothetical protein
VTIYHHDKGLEEAIQFVEDAFSYNSEAKILHAILDTIQ